MIALNNDEIEYIINLLDNDIKNLTDVYERVRKKDYWMNRIKYTKKIKQKYERVKRND